MEDITPEPRKRRKIVADEEDYINEMPRSDNERAKRRDEYVERIKRENRRITTTITAIIISAKIAIVCMLFIALGNMQYGYYESLRVVVTLLAAFVAYMNHAQGNKSMVTYFVIVAIVFNPVLPIKLGRTSWNEIDGITAIITIFTALYDWTEMRKNIEK